jgi:hypothetical protein
MYATRQINNITASKSKNTDRSANERPHHRCITTPRYILGGVGLCWIRVPDNNIIVLGATNDKLVVRAGEDENRNLRIDVKT